MTATTHATNSAAASGPNAAAASAQDNPIISALHGMAVSVLTEQLREMFDKADDILFDSAEKARGGDEQRLYLDTMRIVRVQRAKIIQAFQTSLSNALSEIESSDPQTLNAGDLADMEHWSLQDGDVLEERIAVSNMETKATTLHAHELVELQRRLSRLADVAPGGVSQDAMSPARIIRAFQNSVHNLQVEFPIKLVIYKLFDRVVVGRLSEVFVGANQLLAVHGIEPKNDGAHYGQRRAPTSAGVASGGDANQAPSWASGMDTAAVNGFLGFPASAAAGFPGAGMTPMAPGGYPQAAYGGGFGGASVPAGGAAAWPQGYGGASASAYSDAVLSHDISQILSAYAQGQRPQAPAWLPPQNVALVARMFDSYYRDPRLPEHLKPWLARLQLPIMKTALSDDKFFSDPAHPARRTANDLFEMLLQFGSADAAPPPRALNELQGLIDAMAQAFSLDPDKLKAAEHAPVDDQTADNFLREQEEQLQQRNRARLERVRRVVAHELRRQIGERPVPRGVMRLMLSGFGPLLCLDFIRSGVQGESWNQTMALVERVLASLAPHAGSAEQCAAEEAEIVAALSRRLATIGFSQAKLEEVLAGLLQAYLERVSGTEPTAAAIDAAADSEAAPVAAARAPLSPERELEGLLSIILIPGAWFTVWDPGEQTKHWMRVRGYYPTQNTVLFAHYMEERYLRLHANAFATDLVNGQTAAIDPSRELQSAIDRLAEVPFPRQSEAVVWVTAEGRPVSSQA